MYCTCTVLYYLFTLILIKWGVISSPTAMLPVEPECFKTNSLLQIWHPCSTYVHYSCTHTLKIRKFTYYILYLCILFTMINSKWEWLLSIRNRQDLKLSTRMSPLTNTFIKNRNKHFWSTSKLKWFMLLDEKTAIFKQFNKHNRIKTSPVTDKNVTDTLITLSQK